MLRVLMKIPDSLEKKRLSGWNQRSRLVTKKERADGERTVRRNLRNINDKRRPSLPPTAGFNSFPPISARLLHALRSNIPTWWLSRDGLRLPRRRGYSTTVAFYPHEHKRRKEGAVGA